MSSMPRFRPGPGLPAGQPAGQFSVNGSPVDGPSGLPPTLPPAMPPDAPPARARPLRSGPFGVLDIGSSKVCCLIARMAPDGVPRIEGWSVYASRGIKAGGITELEEAKHAVTEAVAKAETMAGVRLRSITLNLSCGTPASVFDRVQWEIGGRIVTEADVKNLLHEARTRMARPGREIVHVLPLSFEVDETFGVTDPRGMHCNDLTLHYHVVNGGSSAYRNLLATVSAAELDVAELVCAPIASGLSTLVADERELGCVVIDMGGGTTTLAVFSDGQVRHTELVPYGGNHVTGDIARGLGTTVAHAERLKTLWGNAESSPDDEHEMLTIPLVGEEDHNIHKIPRKDVVSIIVPRLEEIFELVLNRLETAGIRQEARSRVVLTGGASQLVGVRELAARVLNCQVRLGRPAGIRGLPDLHDGPALSTASGLLLWSAGFGRALPDLDLSEENDSGIVRRIIEFLKRRL